MADAGIGEAMLASEVIGGTAAAEGGGAALGAGAGADVFGGLAGTGGSGALYAAPEAGGMGLSSMGAMAGPSYAELGYNGANALSGGANALSGGANALSAAAPYTSSAAEQAQIAQDLENGANAGTGTGTTTAPPVTPNPTNPEFMKDPIGWMMNNKVKTAGLAAGALGLGKLMTSKPNYLTPYTPPSAASYGLGNTLSPNYQAQRKFAAGGITVAPGSVPTSGVAPADLSQPQQQVPSGVQALMSQYGVNPQDLKQTLGSLGIRGAANGGLMQANQPNLDFASSGAYPTSQQNNSAYATPSQMPTSAQAVMASYEPNTNPLTGEQTSFASGGIAGLGSYSDGGRMLKGPGDGMSDNIPATISGKQPARLADGEFVVPADVVSHLGNGSTDAGAKQLYSMMNKVRKARTGNPKQGKQINPQKYLKA